MVVLTTNQLHITLDCLIDKIGTLKIQLQKGELQPFSIYSDVVETLLNEFSEEERVKIKRVMVIVN